MRGATCGMQRRQPAGEAELSIEKQRTREETEEESEQDVKRSTSKPLLSLRFGSAVAVQLLARDPSSIHGAGFGVLLTHVKESQLAARFYSRPNNSLDFTRTARLNLMISQACSLLSL